MWASRSLSDLVAGTAGLTMLVLLAAAMPAQASHASLFSVQPFGNGTHDYDLPAGKWFLVYDVTGNDGMTYRLLHGGEAVQADAGCCEGGRLLEVEESGLHRLETTGSGRILLTDPRFVDTVPGNPPWERLVNGSYAIALSHGTAAAYLCWSASSPLDAAMLGEDLATQMESWRQVTRGAHAWWTESFFKTLVVEADRETSLRVEVTGEPCAAGQAALEPDGARRLPGMVPLLPAALLAAARIWRRRT